MKILYLSLEPPLNPDLPATGNQVRVRGLSEALQEAGHQVHLFAPLASSAGSGQDGGEGAHPPQEELQSHAEGDGPAAEGIGPPTAPWEALQRHLQGAQAILVGYWSLLPYVPVSKLPVILDFTAPRLLEEMFEEPHFLAQNARRMISLLPRADFFLVGNQRQADLLLSLLLQAGFDCRRRAPIGLVPVSVSGSALAAEKPAEPICLVNAGVAWPWRNSEPYLGLLRELAEAHEKLQLLELSGPFPGHGEAGAQPAGLLSYKDMRQRLLACHIGLELSERNTEREFSHSFRAAEYLQCGLPIIMNSWLPLAAELRKFNGGWLLDAPAELPPLLKSLLENPALLRDKARGAAHLASEQLNYRRTCAPLLNYLENPAPAELFSPGTGPTAGSAAAPKLPGEGQESAPEISAGQAAKPRSPIFKLILDRLFKTLLCPARPAATPDILMMTRADLFPVDHGAAVKIIRTAEALSRQGRDVWLSTDKRGEYYHFHEGRMSAGKFPLLIRLCAPPRFLVWLLLLLKGYPLSNSFLYLPVVDFSYIVRAIWLTSRKPIGAYQAEFPAYVRPLRFARSLFGGNILLVQHNVEWLRIKSQVRGLSAKSLETLKNLEIAMCGLADLVVAVSENDRLRMKHDGVDPGKLHVVPHGVDLEAFRTAAPVDIRRRFDIPSSHKVLAYHGTYSYAPNLEAMRVMAREILPRLQKRSLEVSVLAIGSKPPGFPLHDNIHFTGSAPNLAELLKAADLAVVPLLQGGGTRMKILDYFAAGVPVVSTAKGIEGIPVRNGREALILDDFEELGIAVENLLRNPSQARLLAEQASLFVKELGWDAIAKRYLLLLGEK